MKLEEPSTSSQTFTDMDERDAFSSSFLGTCSGRYLSLSIRKFLFLMRKSFAHVEARFVIHLHDMQIDFWPEVFLTHVLSFYNCRNQYLLPNEVLLLLVLRFDLLVKLALCPDSWVWSEFK